jgi:hypothetical protein
MTPRPAAYVLTISSASVPESNYSTLIAAVLMISFAMLRRPDRVAERTVYETLLTSLTSLQAL